jgi:hypothetical protein
MQGLFDEKEHSRSPYWLKSICLVFQNNFKEQQREPFNSAGEIFFALNRRES